MSDLSSAAERAADALTIVLRNLRIVEHIADAAHRIMGANDLAPDADCIPDEIADVIGKVEAALIMLGARVPA